MSNKHDRQLPVNSIKHRNVLPSNVVGTAYVSAETQTPSWGYIFNGHLKSPRRVAEGFKQLGAVSHIPRKHRSGI